MKLNSKATATSGIIQGAAHGDQGIVLGGILLGRAKAILVLLRIAELETIHWLQIFSDLFSIVLIKKPVETLARGQAQVMVALGTNALVFFQLGEIQHPFALGALAPQAVRHAGATVLALNAPHGGHDLI